MSIDKTCDKDKINLINPLRSNLFEKWNIYCFQRFRGWI